MPDFDLTDLIGLGDGLPIPPKIKKNAILALANGVAGLVTAVMDLPTAYLERLADGIRSTGQARAELTIEAGKAAGELFREDEQLGRRAVQYFGSRIVREQKNRESVAKKLIGHFRSLPEQDAETEIDDDWLTAFWRLAETKSDHEIQALLARLLFAEVSAPGTVSPHTLQLLSILTSGLAHRFERICRLSIDDGKDVYVIHPNVFSFQNIGPLDEFGVSFDDLFALDGAGLLRSAEALMLNYAPNDAAEPEEVDYAGVTAWIKLEGEQVRLLQFTEAGKELRRLISLSPVAKYTETLQEKLGPEVFQVGTTYEAPPSDR